MASFESELFNLFLKLVRKKRFLRFQLATNKFNFFDSPEPPLNIRQACLVDKYQVNGRNVFTLSPKHQSTGKHILYLHGGAYVQNFKKPHWDFLALLVKKLNCTITAPDYPLAPAYTYVETFAMVEALYQELVLKVNHADFILMGDSAGGGLGLALAQKMKADQVNQPSQIILLSPWLDISLTNPDISHIEDSFLEVESLQKVGKVYAGSTSLDNYLVSPINGPLEGLGKISLFIGTKDVLLADARKLKKMAVAKNIAINYYEYADMVHVWMLLNFPESRKAKQQIMDLVGQC
ncbi:alpha/beta hydrolase fold domain-containing protein [Adhaeribacter rhizoryzae]|uniref:Alpha/beta hydrolase n=1 Tax=Adhaeribacter rhizoryzae TaxID=2607907 RepID=A0A5M6CUS1_9BACT|nr:alpha/beta hydrolase [Adhaeribacter rhizoryzae]KAA5538941.1 alpha/beta hydrolase [Adhaeribacter rhizoryzae]